MSTHATIGIVNEDLSVNSIYLHFDGYLSHAGVTLFNYFNTQQKVKKLINHGDMSSIDKNINPDREHIHSFTEPQPDTCVFYSRDRGENLSIAEHRSEKAFLRRKSNSIFYLFKDNKWYTNSFDGIHELKELELALTENDLLPSLSITAVNHWGPALRIMVKSDNQAHEVIYQDVSDEESHFFYRDGKKPDIPNFEEMLLAQIKKNA